MPCACGDGAEIFFGTTAERGREGARERGRGFVFFFLKRERDTDAGGCAVGVGLRGAIRGPSHARCLTLCFLLRIRGYSIGGQWAHGNNKAMNSIIPCRRALGALSTLVVSGMQLCMYVKARSCVCTACMEGGAKQVSSAAVSRDSRSGVTAGAHLRGSKRGEPVSDLWLASSSSANPRGHGARALPVTVYESTRRWHCWH